MIAPGSPDVASITKNLAAAIWAELVLGPPARIEPAWHRDASCGADTRFHAPDGTGSLAALRRVCTECPVATDCLREALQTEESRYVSAVGIRAGLTPSQRDRLRRGREDARAHLVYSQAAGLQLP